MGRSTLKHWKILGLAISIIAILKNISEKSTTTNKIKFQRFLTDIKHILIWTDLHGVKEEGQTHFIKKKCDQFNCYFTKNKSLFGDLRYFDAIVFNVSDLKQVENVALPDVRGKNQIYIFAANDSAEKYPICNPKYDGFFNWTWTYRHDSTITYKFISIYNNQAEKLGSHFKWPTTMDPVDDSFKYLLSTKTKAAAVLLDQCKSNSDREGLIMRLKNEMTKYNMTLDVFGECGTKKCKRRTLGACNWRLKKQYFFFLALEDSIDRDFITSTVVMAYKNNVVPIVYGGADYGEFLPPNSYINAKNVTVPEIVKTMHESMIVPKKYHEFFRWRHHFQVKESVPLDVCGLCTKLAERPLLVKRSSYEKFREWWWPGYEERCWMVDSVN